MKKMTGLALCLFCIILSVSSLYGETDNKEERGTISATGSASDSFAPDTVEIVLAVESRALSASETATRNKKVADKVMNKLKKHIKDSQKESVKTSSYTLQPVYEYHKMKKKSVLAGYRAVHQINIKTVQINNAGPVIDAALEEGANRIDSIEFSISDNRTYCDDLRARAAVRAKADAEAVARALAVKIADIKNASISCGSEIHRPPVRLGMMQEAATSKVATPIEAGTIKLTASVSTVFYIDK
jgi:uncharacterized protein YggE